MDNNENLLASIEAYVNGEMPQEQLQAFKRKLAEDKQVSAELEAYTTTISALKTLQFKEQLKQEHKGFERASSTSRQMLYYASGIAASILLIITFSYFFIKPVSSSELYLSYFEAYPNLKRARGEANEQLDEALKLYTQGNYKEAISSFNGITAPEDNADKIQFYTAMSYLMLNQTNQAIELLQSIDNTSIYQQQVRWYLALCYLKMDNKANALSYLSFIMDGDFMYKEAQEVINQLK